MAYKPGILSHEGIRHREAFEYYYSLGDKRTLKLVLERFKVSYTTACNWRKSFKWNERVAQRDVAITKQVNKKSINDLVSQKAVYRKEISTNLNIIKAVISKVVRRVNRAGQIVQRGQESPDDKIDINIDIENVLDFERMVSAMERLIKLDLFILGEKEGTNRVELDDVLESLPGEFSIEVRRALSVIISRKGLEESNS